MNRNWTVLHKAELVDAHGNVCVNCGSPDIEWHHIVPISKGGTDSVSNVIPLCHKCHGNSHGQLWGINHGGGRPRIKFDQWDLFGSLIDRKDDLFLKRYGFSPKTRAIELYKRHDNREIIKALFGCKNISRTRDKCVLEMIDGVTITIPFGFERTERFLEVLYEWMESYLDEIEEEIT